jgi:hypothetical protein
MLLFNNGMKDIDIDCGNQTLHISRLGLHICDPSFLRSYVAVDEIIREVDEGQIGLPVRHSNVEPLLHNKDSITVWESAHAAVWRKNLATNEGSMS